MKQKLLCFLVLGLLLIGSAYAQGEKTITGRVNAANGDVLSGVTVRSVGASSSTLTGNDGNYAITVPSSVSQLEFFYLGYETVRLTVGSSNVLNVSMNQASQDIEEVIVSGVAAATSVKKLTVSVTKVNAEQLSAAKPMSVSTALTGKVAGLQSSLSNGTPGAAADILLRGDGNLNLVSSSPLIVMDGMIMNTTLADINIDDVESIEVVKGAAASALYGSRAGNGVIAVTTKRGSMLGMNDIKLNVRNEFGVQNIAKSLDVAMSHPYKLADDWESYKGQFTKYAGVTYPSGYTGAGFHPEIVGSIGVDDDTYMDNPYGVSNNLQEQFFGNGQIMTNFVSLASRTEKSALYSSFENHKSTGIIDNAEGYNRQNFRVNYDLQVFPWLKFNATNLFINRHTQQQGAGSNVFYFILTSPPDVDLFQKNPDGQPYYLRINHNNAETTNPLYNLYKTQPEEKIRRWLGNFGGNIKFANWANMDLNHSIEISNSMYSSYTPKDTWSSTGGTPETMGMSYNNGSLRKDAYEDRSQNTQVTLNLNGHFNDLIVRGKLSYLYEDNDYNYFRANASQFALHDVPHFNNFTNDKYRAVSNNTIERAQNYFVIGSLDYKDRYLFDGMFRYDGSSLFGPESRWNPYYRLSGAYRISQDVDIPGVDELKIRAAHGTAGIRPQYAWQYEYYTLSAGTSSATQKGNLNLRPSQTAETEFGLNIDFLNKFSAEFVYAKSKTTDQFLNVPLIPFLNDGYNRQIQNAGTVEKNTFEATLAARWIERPDFSWRSNISFTKHEQRITELPIPPYLYGSTDGGATQAFYIKEGEVYGVMYGYQFVTSLDQMSRQLPEGASISDYAVNRDGYVIRSGTEGTRDEAVIELLDADGNKLFSRIGNGNPNFFMGIANTFNYKGLNLYFLFDWKQGGDVYNVRKQWLTFSNRNPDMDMTNVADDQKKSIYYYSSLYNRNDPTKHWVEDASYLKLRELSLSYSLPQHVLGNFANNTIKGVTMSVIGRNLLTFTKYSGYDPEVGSIREPYEGTYRYPNFRSFSFSLSLDF